MTIITRETSEMVVVDGAETTEITEMTSGREEEGMAMKMREAADSSPITADLTLTNQVPHSKKGGRGRAEMREK